MMMNQPTVPPIGEDADLHANSLAPLLPSPEALERLVYLVGPARGGTSVIHMAMDAHPRALVLPGVTHFLQQVWRYRRTVDERLLRLIVRSAEAWDNPAILARLDPQQNADFVKLVNAAFAKRTLATLYKLYPIAFALGPRCRKTAGEIACWHDKSNDWRYLGALADAFPSARFIFVVRDPRSVALSGALRLSLKAGETSARVDPISLIDMALYWRIMVQRCLDFARRHPGRSKLIRFEDFLSQPVHTVSELFRYTVGAAPSRSTIESHLGTIAGGASNDARERYRGVSRNPMERWKEALSVEEIGLVEQLTAPTALKLGYDVARRSGALASLRAIGAVSGRLARARAAAKVILEEAYELRLGRIDPATLISQRVESIA